MEVFSIVELLAIILGKIDCGSDWKRARLVCRSWRQACGNRVAEFSNHLWTLVQKFPDKPWHWHWLSNNPNVTWEIVVANPDKPWDWKGLSSNPNITLDIVLANPDPRILIASYLEQNQLAVDSVLGKKLLECAAWDWRWLSYNPNVTWDVVVANLDKDWNWYPLSTNPNITWDVVAANPDKPWNWDGLSCNPNITWDIIVANPDRPWNWSEVSRNSNITWKIVLANPDPHVLIAPPRKRSDQLAVDSVLGKKLLKHAAWDWHWLSYNPNVTWDVVVANPDKPWNWYWLSSNSIITWDLVLSNMDKPWDWQGLSRNSNITWEIVVANPDKPWNWYTLSMNRFNKKKKYVQ